MADYIRKRLAYLSCIIASVILLWVTLFLTRERILLAVGDFLVVQDKLQPADAIYVISGSDDARIDYGIQLFQQGYAGRIIFTGGWCPCTQANSAERGKERAIKQDVPPQAIVIDGSPVSSTYSEVAKAKELIAQSQVPIQSLIVVSDPYHMRRARWTCRRVLGDQIRLQMAPVPFEQSSYQRRWWTDEMSRQFVTSEYQKIAYYYARYQLAVGPLREWLASLDQD